MFLTKTFIRHKNIKTNIFRKQGKNLIMCEYFCIEFIDFNTSLLSPYDFEKNDNVTLS